MNIKPEVSDQFLVEPPDTWRPEIRIEFDKCTDNLLVMCADEGIELGYALTTRNGSLSDFADSFNRLRKHVWAQVEAKRSSRIDLINRLRGGT